ncbi:hypothetical protein EDB86DRAFT_2882812 [Lactarius hatsudake]|nr:hypothetical protein EDB86DRAFT_2882812 [Lactarius hatsudake]
MAAGMVWLNAHIEEKMQTFGMILLCSLIAFPYRSIAYQCVTSCTMLLLSPVTLKRGFNICQIRQPAIGALRPHADAM